MCADFPLAEQRYTSSLSCKSVIIFCICFVGLAVPPDPFRNIQTFKVLDWFQVAGYLMTQQICRRGDPIREQSGRLMAGV
jgi:hypothetical protein